MDPAFLVPHNPHHHSHRSHYQPRGRDHDRGHRCSNKPLFPPLPTTVFTDDDLSSDEIICSGSGCDDNDDSNDDGDGRDQTNRILAQAEQYLRGTNSIYLHSASLRGPVPESPWRRTGTGVRMAREGAREEQPVSDLPAPKSSTTTATTATKSASSSANTSLSRSSPPIGSGSRSEDISGFHGCRRHGAQQDIFSSTFEGVPESTNPGTSGYSSGRGEGRTTPGKLPSSSPPPLPPPPPPPPSPPPPPQHLRPSTTDDFTIGTIEQQRQPHQGRRIAWEGVAAAHQHARKDNLSSKLIVSPAPGGFDKRATTTTVSSSPPIPPPTPPAAVPSRRTPQMTDDDFALGTVRRLRYAKHHSCDALSSTSPTARPAPLPPPGGAPRKNKRPKEAAAVMAIKTSAQVDWNKERPEDEGAELTTKKRKVASQEQQQQQSTAPSSFSDALPIRENSTTNSPGKPEADSSKPPQAPQTPPPPPPPSPSSALNEDKENGGNSNSKGLPNRHLPLGSTTTERRARAGVSSHRLRTLSEVREHGDIMRQAVSSYIHDMSITKDHSEPGTIVPEAPWWQEAQARLLATQNAPADSPTHYPGSRSSSSGGIVSIQDDSTLLPAPPAPPAHGITTPEKHCRRHNFSSGSGPTGGGEFTLTGSEAAAELTPFRSFATPSPERNNCVSSSPQPRLDNKLAGAFTQEPEIQAHDHAATDVEFAHLSLDHQSMPGVATTPPHRHLDPPGHQHTETATEIDTVPGRIPNGRGHDDADDDVEAMMGIMGTGEWNIDEELRKLAGTAAGGGDRVCVDGRRARRGPRTRRKKGLWG